MISSMLGAAASSALSVRGRIDLHAGGETATQVRVTRAGLPTGATAPLGFDLRLDRFDLVNHETEYRVGYYEQAVVEDDRGRHRQWKLRASFDPDLARHRLPGGDSFQLAAVWPDPQDPASRQWLSPAVQLVATRDGQLLEKLLRADPPEALFLDDRRALVFERREGEVKAFLSTITATRGADALNAQVAVNAPVTFAGWTLYQVNHDPRDPSYSGLEAVHDPGVAWVFVGFALISLGVFTMFYVEPRLAARRPGPGAAQARAA